MPIADYVGTRQRNTIAFFGEDPPLNAKKTLKVCAGYELCRFETEDLRDVGKLTTTAAVIFSQVTQKPTKILRDLAACAGTLLGHDCRVIVRPIRAASGANAAHFRQLIVDELLALKLPPSGLDRNEAAVLPPHLGSPNENPRSPWVHILDPETAWQGIIQHLQHNAPSSPPSYDLSIETFDPEGNPYPLCDEQTMLVRRSFSDCSAVRLQGLGNGLSDVMTFRAYARVPSAASSDKSPFQYFVKIGARATLAREYAEYCEVALDNIPHHLGPRLRLSRCNLSHTQGIIVADYVHGAETLRDCAKAGRAVPAIANLFNATLRAWHNGAREENRSLSALLSADLPVELPAHRKRQIASCGATTTPATLKVLVEGFESKPFIVGVIHGDLHATNVLVRNQDAILIDFEKVQTNAPLLRDFASLEAGLFVDGFIGDRRSPAELLLSVGTLYEIAAFESSSRVTCDQADESWWYFDCVRQIRMQASLVEKAPRQYALALAVSLIRKACQNKDFSNDKLGALGLSRECVRALAYVLAERVLLEMRSGGASANP